MVLQVCLDHLANLDTLVGMENTDNVARKVLKVIQESR